MATSHGIHGRHVVVTGGRGALGGGVVEVLTAHGAIVHVADLPDVHLDDEAATVAFFAALPPVWASIHLVGGFAMAPIAETSLADFEAQWRLNTVTCFLVVPRGGRVDAHDGGGGRIVNVAARPSLAAGRRDERVPRGQGGRRGADPGARRRGARRGHPRQRGVALDHRHPGEPRRDAERRPRRAGPSPREIAETIAFLASPENTLTSGALVPVYGRA